MKTPCKDCEERILGCHSTCERYKAFKKKIDEKRQKRAHYNDVYGDWYNVKKKGWKIK